MKRKAFILTEILTGLLLQAGFAVTLCGAFYMLVTFSASMSNALSSNSQGQRVITYIDSRIRNAGLGFRNCSSSVSIADVMEISDSNLKTLNKLYLPVAITSTLDKEGNILSYGDINYGKLISYDGRYYEGNVLHLLYAQKDATENEEVVLGIGASNDVSTDVITIPANSSDKFRFLFDRRDYTKEGTGDDNHNASKFALKGSANKNNLEHWAVMEASGVPFLISDYTTTAPYSFKLTAPKTKSVKIYPMSEILTLNFEKMYIISNDSGSNFVFQLPKDGLSNGLDTYKYQASDILEIYMRLDTKPDYDPNLHLPPAPIFDLKVLVSTGAAVIVNNEVVRTSCPDNWPRAYWKDEFGLYNVQVLEASWKLYNLTGFKFGTAWP